MNTLRWLAYLPIALVVSFFSTAMINFGGQIVFGSFKFTSALMYITSGLFGAMTLIFISKKIAPKYNKIVRISLFLTLIIIGFVQVSNVFIDFGFSDNNPFSTLNLKYSQAFIGVGLLFGLFFINDSSENAINTGENLNLTLEEDDQTDIEAEMIRGTIKDMKDFVNRLSSQKETLSVMFNESSDFINIKKQEKHLIISFPTVTDRMKAKKDIFKLAVHVNEGEIIAEDDVIIRVKFELNNLEQVKALIITTFELSNNSILDFDIQ